MQRADTSLTNVVVLHVEARAKLQSFLAVDDVSECLAVDIPHRGVEETWTHVAGRLDHRGHPGCVATRSHVRDLAEVGAEMTDDFAQLTCTFNDKAGVQ